MKDRRISINTGAATNYSEDIFEILKMLKEAGYDTYDFTMCVQSIIENILEKDNYKELALDIKKYADSLGMVCNQTHANFPTYRPSYTDEENEHAKFLTFRSLEVTKILGAKYCVVHPVNDFGNDKNIKFYEQFVDTLKELDIKIGIENMFNWADGHATKAACSHRDEFKELLNSLRKYDCFVACVDIGHAEIFKDESAVEMIKTIGSDMKMMHLHDNDRRCDYHRLPFTYDINYGPILDALNEIGYDGDITFECENTPRKFPKELNPSVFKLSHDVGEYFKNELEKRHL